MGRAQGVLAGVPFFDEIFAQLGCSYVPLSSYSTDRRC